MKGIVATRAIAEEHFRAESALENFVAIWV
jgi:hypothetical protein